jgi:hypothetical protein
MSYEIGETKTYNWICGNQTGSNTNDVGFPNEVGNPTHELSSYTRNYTKLILIFIEQMRSLNSFTSGKLPQHTKEIKALQILQTRI